MNNISEAFEIYMLNKFFNIKHIMNSNKNFIFMKKNSKRILMVRQIF